METLKNILAAKKIVYLATGGNPVGRGEGRGVHLWAILVILSLAMYPTNGLPNPEGQMGQEKECLKKTQREPTGSQKGVFKAHFDCPKIQKRGICSHNESWFKICELKENMLYHNPVAMSRKRRELGSIHVIPICEQCNKTMWVGGKQESTFVAYLRVNKLCYEQNNLGMCTLNGKTYWVGQNTKLQTATLNSGPIILDMLSENNERVSLKLERTFCFSHNEEGMDPESKIQSCSRIKKAGARGKKEKDGAGKDEVT
ncbi:hypothetical protein DUI87_01997 [Hirundo rustica rustica]|uniref:Uncharacterized protein n=1 Tax=Hirundo rustica rustica TaxID=333673 RepID=A0A3M0L6M8_HIRRU|nr:hypothetical protein DUI87_01997 [Hirundo rustica rustica]